MKMALISVLAAAVLCGGSALAWRGLGGGTDSAQESAGLADLRKEVDGLRARIASLEKAQAALAQSSIRGRRAGGEAPGEDAAPTLAILKPASGTAQAGADAAEAAPGTARAAPGTAKAAAGAAEASATRLEEALEELSSRETGWNRRQEVWKELGQAGLVDAAVAAFEERAEENPKDAEARSQLGGAYLQKLNVVKDFEKGEWAMKADHAFDAALALNERHWEARFMKATSLSYWPAIAGKQPEAIRHFEVLRQQQAEGPPRSGQDQTYLMLGNLYRTRGEEAKAREAWKEGAARHPQNQELGALAAEGGVAAEGER